MNLHTELTNLVKALTDKNIQYALCGGLAMAAHGWPRATMDVDLLILEADYPSIRDLARGLGYDIENPEFAVAKGAIRIRRLVKIEGIHVVPLDLLLVGPLLEPVWASRSVLASEESDPVWVVSPEGLKIMKRLRASKQDLADIERIDGENG